MSNILSYGFYFPRYQVEEKILSPRFGKKGKRNVAYADEDVITLAYEAVYNCLGENKNIDAIFFATTSPVFQNRYHASFLADLLNLPKEISALDFGLTLRAGTDALLLAHQLIEAGTYKNILIVASEVHFPEVGNEIKDLFGHGAVAMLVGKEKGIAGINNGQSFSCNIAEKFIYKNKKINYDPRFSVDTGFKANVKSALEKSKIKSSDYDAVILNSLYSKLGGDIFLKAGFEENQFAKDNISFNTGNTGSCHALLQLIDAIENKKKKILLFDYFNGTNVLEIHSKGTTDEKLLQNIFPNRYNIETYQDYLLLRKAGNFNSPEYEPVKMFSSEIMNEREKEILIYFNGFQCDKCKSVYLIKTIRCKKCKGEKFSLRKLDKTGTVYSLTREHYFPSTFVPITMAVIDLDGSGRVTVQVTDDMYVGVKNKIQIGSKVKLVLRKMIENDMQPNYFWKATLI